MGTRVCLLSSFLLFRIRYVRYLMALWCMFFMSVLMLLVGIFRLVSFLMDFSCMAPLTPSVMVTRGLVFHPLFCKAFINGLYLACLCRRACYGNLSWQYVNSISWIVVVGDGFSSVWDWFGAPMMQGIYGLSLA